MSEFVVKEIAPSACADLARTADIHPVTARCLIARGASNERAAATFLEPRLKNLRAPEGLSDLDRAVARIAAAITGGERVGIFGDYDVDGVTTATLLATAIEALGGRALPRVARRSAGYGFGQDDATFFADQCCHLVITGDCGTSDVAAISEANRRGLDVVVIDHHTVPDSADQHPAYALINPFRPDSTFAFTGFASVGLAFYVMQRVKSALKTAGAFANRFAPDLREWLDLVAVGTIADLVPLTDENRILTSWGLKVLRRRQRPGFDSLLRSAGVEDDAVIGAREVGWKIAPRLNAPGRLGDAEPALKLLLAQSREEADELAATLEQSNDDRRAAQDEAYAEALAMIEAEAPGPCVVVAGRGWKPGVVGIVAARLVDLLKRPVFAIAIDEDGVARGSARTFGGVNIYNALARSSAWLERFGGHAAAAGLTMAEANIGALRGELEAAVAEQQAGRPPTARLADADVEIADLLEVTRKPSKLALELDALRPFGKGNPPLRLVVRGAEVCESRKVGAGRDHLKLVVKGGAAEIGAIGFGLADEAPELGSHVDIVCSPLLNHWRGTVRVELQIHALAAAAAPAQADAKEAGEASGALAAGASVNVPF